MTKKDACIIAKARTAIDDAMPRELFPDFPNREDMHRMRLARNAADAALHAFDAEMKKQLEGMDEQQALRAWWSVCTRQLFNLECAVSAYER
jgi:hypothetical protein